MKRLLLILLVVVTAGAQQPKPDAVTLPAEASKAYNAIAARQAELAQQWQILESQRQMLLIGANVPTEARMNCTGDPVVCKKPETAKAGPEKK